VSLEVHMEAVIERLWGITSKLRWSKFVEGPGGRDHPNLETVFV